MNRREVKAERVAIALDDLRDAINRNLIEKGTGAFVSHHEILGAITEEYHELIHATWGDETLEEELLHIAALCVFAVAGLQSEEAGQIMENLTEAQAKKLFDSGWWKELTPREIATFQLYEERLCMPFDVFQEAMEKTLGRSIWTHELALNRQGLMDELRGDAPPPTMEEIINLIPEEKRIIIM